MYEYFFSFQIKCQITFCIISLLFDESICGAKVTIFNEISNKILTFFKKVNETGSVVLLYTVFSC